MAGKNIIIAFDGTGQKAQNRTNVDLLAEASLNDGKQQCVWYDPGVGTSAGAYIRGEAWGYGISKNLMEAYRYLAKTLNEEDRLYIFGFSRGAFSARSLGGLIRKCHILKDPGKTDDAYRLYQKKDASPDTDEAIAFRNSFSKPWKPNIHFMGVWDTVGRLGIPNSIRLFGKNSDEFHDTTLSGYTKNAYHAVAIDENRKDFDVVLWTGCNPDTVCEQRLFVGAHSNVGGGYNDNLLSTIPLYWMLERAVQCGLILSPNKGLDAYKYSADAIKGEIIDSYADFILGMYKWRFGRYIRQFDIGVNVVLDDSVRNRMSLDSAYRPTNISKFI